MMTSERLGVRTVSTQNSLGSGRNAGDDDD
jgi:hypothetical protein